MIPRYTRPEMVAIWSPETRFRIWFEIEAHACDAHGRARHHPEGSGADDLGEGRRGDLRRRAHRRDRARGQARRHRLPHPSRRDRRPRGALRPPGHDLVRRARHLLQRAARRAPPTCCIADIDAPARRAEDARLRAQDDADHRPQPRHPCRADHLRRSSSPRPMPSSPAPRAGSSPRARRSRPAPSPARSAPSPTSIRASRSMSPTKLGLRPEPVSTQVIPRDRHAMYFATLGVVASLDRAAGDRDPPSAAHRGAGGRGVSSRRARRARRPCRTSATRC